LNQNLFLKIIKVNFNILWHIRIQPKPVDCHLTLDKLHRKNITILPIRALQRLIGIVEEVSGETENRLKGFNAGENSLSFVLLMLIIYFSDKVSEEGVD
jgi:hypothetical protein